MPAELPPPRASGGGEPLRRRDQRQLDEARLAGRVIHALHGLAVATSGVERTFTHDGHCYSHTIDPRNGWPVASGLACATVLHTSCMEADAYATALMVMGAEHAQAFAAAHDLAARVVTDDGTEHISPALAAMLA